MGEPVSVTEKRSSRDGFVRFETNRWFTGMDHERYSAGEPIAGDRPADLAANLLFESGKVDQVHVYGQSITVKLSAGSDSEGLKEALENMYIYYKPGVEVPTEESFSA